MTPPQNQRVCEHVPALLGTTEAMDERYGLQDYGCRKLSKYRRELGAPRPAEKGHIVTWFRDWVSLRTLIGKDLTRVYDFSGKELIVKSSSPNEHWRVAWEHYQATSANHCTPSAKRDPPGSAREAVRV